MSHNLTLEQKQQAYAQLKDIKTGFAANGWFSATSGNLSIRVGDFAPDSFAFAITSSGKDKSVHTPEDYILVDENGKAIEATNLKPSAETIIHKEIYRLTGCGAVFHVHTIANNLVTDIFGDRDIQSIEPPCTSIPIQGLELIKAFNIWEENVKIEVPVLPNYTDIPKIAALIPEKLNPHVPGILLDRHGIYAWGANAFEAKRHIEAFEFLFEYLIRLNSLK